MTGLLTTAFLIIACLGQMDPGHHVVSLSDKAACILKDTGCGIGSSIECWGDYKIANYVPAGNDFISVAVGHQAACALRVTGSITCFGMDPGPYGGAVADAPTDTDFVQLGAFKGYNPCALKASGEIKCWGQTRSYHIIPQTPTGAGYTAVTCGSNWCCAINAVKNLECWGRATDYVNMKNFINSEQDDTHKFVGITIGHGDACALQEDGTVRCWGFYGDTAMLGDYYWQPYDFKEHDDYRRVVMGKWTTCSIRGSARTLYCFGSPNHYPMSRLPDEEFNDVVAVAGSQYHFCFVTADGNLNCWGLTGQRSRTGAVVEDMPITDGDVTIPSDNYCVTQAITQCSASGATRASGKEQALADIPWMREQSVADSSGSIQLEELVAELKRDREMQLAENNRLKEANEALLESLRELEANQLKSDREMQLAEEKNRLKGANEALLESLRALEA